MDLKQDEVTDFLINLRKNLNYSSDILRRFSIM